MAERIWVKPVNPRAGVILWEPDTEHPRNEAWIAGDAMATSFDALPATEVGRTGAVDKLLRDGVIVQVQPTEQDRKIAAETPAFPAGGVAGPPPPALPAAPADEPRSGRRTSARSDEGGA